MRADVHMHCNFSNDSDSTPEEMILGAIDKGLKVICFTDHYDKDDMEWGDEPIFDPEEYFAVLIPLVQRYQDKIDVRIGVELGLQPYLADYYTEFVAKYPFDFVIGSAHTAHGIDPATGQLFVGRSDEEVYRMMFEEMIKDIENFTDFDVMGHLDYVVRYGKDREKYYSYERLSDEIDILLRRIIELGKGIELNTAGLKYGLSFAHPHPAILKHYRELGGEIITIGADGHKPEHIAYDFHKVSDILTECGFGYYAEFRERKPIFKRLA